MKLLALTLTLTLTLGAISQTRVLFLGNSYTYYNTMPKTLEKMASSTGDSIITDQSTPGGYTLQGHSTNATSLNKIRQGNWDYVVLQEQSQRPSFPISQVNSDVFPYAIRLNDSIQQNNACAQTLFFMTWGRQNGDASNCASWPPVCTYKGMDDLLRQRYLTMADTTDAMVSPVGAVWRAIRNRFPSINLYASDGSHPSATGSYAIACTFYTAILRKDPRNITFNGNEFPAVADSIKSVVKSVVLDSLIQWKADTALPSASFTYQNLPSLQVKLDAILTNANSWKWSIDDTTYGSINPVVHTLSSGGEFITTLTAYNGCDSSRHEENIGYWTFGLNEYDEDIVQIYPNPTKDMLFIRVEQEVIGEVVELFTLDGKRVLSARITSETTTIDVSSLPTGTYVLSLAGGFERKVMVE